MRLTLSCVSKLFGLHWVFRGIDFSLQEGHVLLVTGPNGAGKSTLLRIIAGLERPTAGRVDCRVPQKRLGYLGHQTGLYPQLTALENLRFVARLYGLSRDLSVEASLLAVLARVALLPAALVRVGCFSRGMAQRLALARVLLLAPDLLLLDEPSASLDQCAKVAMHREIVACRARRASVVWVSHNLEQDLPLADWLLVLDNGVQAFFGPSAEYPLANLPNRITV